MSKRPACKLMTALAVFLLMFLGGQVAAVAVTPIQVASSFHQGRPDVSGSLVTWKRDLPAPTDYEIYANSLTSLSSPGEQDITESEGGNQINPVTNGSDIIWEDWSAGNGNIYMNHLGVNEPLVTGPGNKGILAVSGSTVAFVYNPGTASTSITDPGNQVYSIDISGGLAQPVDPTGAAQWQPRISGSKVVWMDYRNGNWDIFEKDISDGLERQLTAGGDNEFPDISGNIVVWRSYLDGAWNMHWMNLADGIDHQLTSNNAYKQSICISGSLVVWMDGSNDPDPASPSAYDLFMEDLNTGVVSTLAALNTNPAYPAASNGAVVWQDDPSGSWDGYDIMAAYVPTAKLSLKLLSQSAFWASFKDYQNGLLSVKYTIGAPPDAAAAYGTQILASPATSGVMLNTPTPVPVGDIQPGGQTSVTVKYQVPVGVSAFRTTLYASASDAVGDTAYFPGPPPGA